jgi:hypothetical protein
MDSTAGGVPFSESLCHRCDAPMRLVRTERSTFLLCPWVAEKYPRQPVLRCVAYQPRCASQGDDSTAIP